MHIHMYLYCWFEISERTLHQVGQLLLKVEADIEVSQQLHHPHQQGGAERHLATYHMTQC